MERAVLALVVLDGPDLGIGEVRVIDEALEAVAIDAEGTDDMGGGAAAIGGDGEVGKGGLGEPGLISKLLEGGESSIAVAQAQDLVCPIGAYAGDGTQGGAVGGVDVYPFLKGDLVVPFKGCWVLGDGCWRITYGDTSVSFWGSDKVIFFGDADEGTEVLPLLIGEEGGVHEVFGGVVAVASGTVAADAADLGGGESKA